MDDARYEANRINGTLNDIKEYTGLGIDCIDETNDALLSVKNMFVEIINIISYAQCEHLNIVWTGVVEDGFCDEVFSGFYVFWVSQLCAAACLFVLMVFLLGYSLSNGDVSAGLHFLFDADFSKITGDAVLVAMGHAFFTLSLGMGSIMI